MKRKTTKKQPPSKAGYRTVTLQGCVYHRYIDERLTSVVFVTGGSAGHFDYPATLTIRVPKVKR